MSIDPRTDTLPLCHECTSREVCLSQRDRCAECHARWLVSNDMLTEAAAFAEDEDVDLALLLTEEHQTRELCCALKSGALRGQVAS